MRRAQDNRGVLVLVGAALVLGCPSDDTTASGGQDTSSGSADDGGPTTATTSNPTTGVSATMTGGSSGMTTMTMTTVDPDSSTTDPPGTSSSSSSSSGTAAGSSSSGSSSSGSSSSGTTSNASSSSSTGGGLLECTDLGNMSPVMIMGSTVGFADDLSDTCGGAGAADIIFEWTVPQDGFYIIDTVGSSFNTVLYAMGAGCFGVPGGACSNDFDGTAQSQLFGAGLIQDTLFGLVVDGFAAGDEGDFVFNITQPTCVPVDMGNELPDTASGSTVGAGDDQFASCGGTGAEDEELTWQAPGDGLVRIDTVGSNYDTVLSVRRGGDCTGPQFACNDDSFGAVSGESAVCVGVSSGESLSLIVDGAAMAAGDYTVNITDESGNIAGAGDCCTNTGSPLCDDLAVASCASELLSDCCVGNWGLFCASINNDNCNVGGCSLVPAGDCCVAQGTPGCDTAAVQDCVCNQFGDTFCCNTFWDAQCVAEATANCLADC